MNEHSASDETVDKSEPEKNSNRRSLPMHIRILGLRQARYVSGVIGHILSMIIFTFIVGLFLLRSVDIPIERIEQRVREASISALGFVFPDYITEVSSVGVDLDSAKKGWVKVNNITLLDVVQNRSIFIDEFRLSPSIRGLFTGEFKFNFIGARRADIQFQITESENRTRFGYPINLLDIPANVLRDGGEVNIEDMTMIVTNATEEELVAIKNFEASLVKVNNGYDGRITARHADKEAGAFSFRVQREGAKVSWQGNAREYKITPDKKLGVDFDLDLVFEDVPDYDLTEQSDNVRYPYRFLTKADGLARVKFADWIGGGRFEYNPKTKNLSLAEMSLSNTEYNFDGEVDITVGDEMLITGKDIALSYPTNLDIALVDELSFVGKLDLLKRQFELGEIVVANGPFEMSGKGAVVFEDQLRANFTLESPLMSRDALIEYWPKGIAQKTFDWATANIDQADLENFRLDTLYDDKFAFDLSMVGRDVVLKPTKWLPRFQSDFVRLHMTNEHLLIATPIAQTAHQENADVQLKDIQLWVPEVAVKPLNAELTGNFSGKIEDVLTVLSSDPVALPKRMNMDANRFVGNTTGQINVHFPMQAGTKIADVDMDVKANISDFRLSKLINGKTLSAHAIDIAVDEEGLNVSGYASLDDLVGLASLKQSFSKGSKPDIEIKGHATRKQLKVIGLNLPSIILGDGISYNANINPSSEAVEVVGRADIKNLGLSIGSLGQAKPIGRAGYADFVVKASGNNVDVSKLNISSGGLSANGSLSVRSGKLTELNFPNVNWPGRYTGSLNLDASSRIKLRNGAINIESLNSARAGASGAQIVDLENVSIRLSDPIQFSNVFGQIKLGSTVSGELNGRFGGKSPVNVKLSPSQGQTLAVLRAQDAGSVLRNAGLFGDLRGGNLVLQVRTTDRAGLYAGKFLVQNSQLSNSRTAVQLLQAASIFGILNAEGLQLDEIGGDLLLYPDHIELFSGRAFGPSIGLTLGGSYQTNSQNVNLVGVLTPAYLLNGAFQRIPGFGELLGGNVGEGVFGVTYQIQGRSPNYQIQANPLSLLTPGKFREIWSNVPQSGTIPSRYRIE